MVDVQRAATLAGFGGSSDARVATRPSKTEIVAPLQLPLEDRANSYFVNNYVFTSRTAGIPTGGYIDCIVPLKSSNSTQPHLEFAFNACSVATLSGRGKAHSDAYALKLYTKAVAATFVALRDAELARQDSTLATVLLLGLFENITTKSPGVNKWGMHIEAAVTIVKARGRDMRRTETGLTLFAAVRSLLIIRMFFNPTSLPSQDANFWFPAWADVDDDPCTKFEQLNFRAAQLQMESTSLLDDETIAEKSDKATKLIHKCQLLDQELADYAEAYRDMFWWHTVAWQDGPSTHDFSKADVYPGRIDIYKDPFTGRLWNFLRSSRLVLSTVIIRLAAWVCDPLDYRTSPEYGKALKTCAGLITDLIASIPYMLGYCPRYGYGYGKAFSQESGNSRDQMCLAGSFLLFPLTLILESDFLTDSQRKWRCYRVPSMLIAQDRMILSRKSKVTETKRTA
ncbi:hypothetical protein QQS21_001370 [Conoideocrella luteorostrata]|uniref:Uncharacterized protein n=1 Tax=Conoideocrella luteorostrata TaxID=1105319 RepID=A0AAJ0FYB8_9HYPO|nr:hypothetical protein QQS21_001370 [Conoideocrella luteorostrata]